MVLTAEFRPEKNVKNFKIFDQYNKRKIDYLRSYIPEKKRDVFDLIPFLLHEENPAPSKVGGFDECPLVGISCFAYTPGLRKLIKKYFPQFRTQRQAKSILPISFLALMGSIGTVAFTKQSDMDFWVGIDLQEDDMDLFSLEERFKKIEQWTYETAGLETHFFIADLNKIRNDDYGELNEESCGSTLGKLLKDEFYRTAIIVAGKIPFYWVMRPGISDPGYNNNIKALCTDSSFPYHNCVDLGNVHTIDKGEYFGAVLWQLLKGLHNPFKSVLKMAVLDKYSTEEKRVIPLCEEYKKEVFESQSPGMLDSYLFMVESLRSHYTNHNLIAKRRIIEECFLIRNLLSFETVQMEDKARTQLFFYIGQQWGWPKEQIKEFACFRDWDFFTIEGLKKRVVWFLIDSYKRIRERTRSIKVYVSDREFTIIAKKLKCIFELKKGKIPYEFSLLNPKDVSTIEIKKNDTPDKDNGWQVSIKIKGAQSDLPQFLRKVQNPLVACAWCSLNQFYKGKEKITVSRGIKLSTTEIINLIRSCDNFFPRDDVDRLKILDLLENLYVTHLYVMPNWEDPDWNSDVASLCVLYKNSIGELFYDGFKGSNWKAWLTKELFEKKIGMQHLKKLTWSTHIFKGTVTSTRRVSGIVSQCIKDYIGKSVIPTQVHK